MFQTHPIITARMIQRRQASIFGQSIALKHQAISNDPPPLCRVGRPLNRNSMWAPYDLLRLFCTMQNLHTKISESSLFKPVGSKRIFQSRTRQGSLSFPVYSYRTIKYKQLPFSHPVDITVNQLQCSVKSKTADFFIFLSKIMCH